jgi:flagellar motor switch protein FliM
MTDGSLRSAGVDAAGTTGAEYLSQDEVDALLKGVGETADEPAEPDGVRPYRVGSQGRVVRGGMPVFELINDRCAGGLRAGFAEFLRRRPQVVVGPARTIAYGDFVRSVAMPASLNLVRAEGLRGNALLVLEGALVSLAVDTLFGGNGRLLRRGAGREFTPTESRIIRRLVDIVLREYAHAWASAHPLRFEFVRAESLPQFASIAAPADTVVVTTYTIEIGEGSGAFHLCIPYAMLEPLAGIVHDTRPGDAAAPDQRWGELLTQRLRGAAVDVAATLGSTALTVRELLALRVGDVLPLEIPPTLRADVNGVPLLECRYGLANGRYAVAVLRLLASPDDVLAGGIHV